MRVIRLKELNINQFRGLRDLSVKFSQGKTLIHGANATGKSTIFEAFCWVLFGKDSQERKDFNLKPFNAGSTDDKTIGVEVVFELEDDKGKETTKLSRVYSEQWVKPRGVEELVFKGHKTDYYYNDVPLNMKDYNKKVADLLSEEAFKLCSQPMSFISMDWKKQREYLFSFVDEVTDDEVYARDSKLEALRTIGERKDFDQYRKELRATIRKTKDELKAIDPKIEQVQAMKPQPLDIKSLKAELNDIDKALASFKVARSIQQQSQAKERREERERYERVKRLEHLLIKLETDIKIAKDEAQGKLKAELIRIEQHIKTLEGTLNFQRERSKDIDNKLAKLRNDWKEFNALQSKLIVERSVCPSCKRPLEGKQLKACQEEVKKHREEELARVNREGKNFKALQESNQNVIHKTEEELKTRIEELEVLKSKKIETSSTKIKELKAEKEQAKKELEQAQQVLAEYQSKSESKAEPLEASREAELVAQRDELLKKLNEQESIKKFDDEVKRLQTEGRRLVEGLTKAEQQEHLLTCFIRSKIELCTERINGLFKDVTFNFFNYTNDGNEVEVCEVLVNNVPISVVNTADRINAGLRIIEYLQQHYQTKVPVFIDNAESVNDVYPISTQTIELIVTHDKELKIITQ